MNPGIKRALESAKTWTALGAVALSIVAALGLPADRIAPVITGIVALAITVIAGGAWEDGAAKVNGNFTPPQPAPAEKIAASTTPEK